jgi:predicted nucleic acid-binding protein
VEESLVLETTFLIDLEREAGRRLSGPAHALLERHGAARLFLTPTIAGELAAGVSLAERSAWDALLAPFPVLEITMEAAWQYGQAYRYLQAQGLLIGANDLWIAATSLAHGCALATRDVEHYQRVPGLRVVSYRD